ncbi:hypothetical protein L249_8475 [Ophiocordyceps polyrhachis-furcata BCC 54312]|uniref:DNA-directed RNA polymerase RBP11-like dimerisation domain-containing protein n=1 Tax=Ophiocordyceps polyrhachis-furcata BCC 54312 TaxID=1330021 RepID=A0A367L6P2_9HYPO|nr:hypothetical protein L249_8475 [Ophiocordyceps polyrhachis-furcata BCC 54312]
MPGRTKKAEETPSQDISMQDAPPSAQPEAVQDAEMGGDEAEAESEQDDEPQVQRVKILPGSTETGASFEFLDEGHTLGNALRYIIMKKWVDLLMLGPFASFLLFVLVLMRHSPDVEFCAYAIPHPSEPKMNIRIQTYEGTAVDALKKGLADLKDVCDVVADEFWTKRSAYNDKEAMT